MKKNKMMRIASFLLIAVLLTTSVISGTFAKYVTTGEVGDKARVAKFGVVIDTEGTLFGKEYVDVYEGNGPDDGTGEVITVKSSTEDNVVAPGTNNSYTGGYNFSITGTPEVSVKVAINFGDELSDIWLTQGKYPDMTTNAVDAFEIADDYYPIQYTLYNRHSESANWSVVDDLQNVPLYKISQYFEAVNEEYKDEVFEPNTDLADVYGYYRLDWEWAFEDAQTLNGANFTAEQVDQADTLLGDLMADELDDTTIVDDAVAAYDAANGGSAWSGLAGLTNVEDYGAGYNNRPEATNRGDYSLKAVFDMTISVTQVD
ncbi:MAG: hypothetical protein J1E34_08065 [Oscillospiraceae bacterium]|nr:hypothetical protein [Oscillospiraceae bacterium]